MVFSLFDADEFRRWQGQVLSFGIAGFLPSYRAFCLERGISVEEVISEGGAPLLSWARLFGALRRLKPQVVVLHSLTAILPVWLYCRLFGIHFVTVEHNANQVKTRLEWAASLFAQVLSDDLIYLTSEYAQEIRQKFGRLATSKFHIVPNGISLSEFFPVGKGASRGYFRIGMAARFSHTKSQDILVESVDLLRSWGSKVQLLLAGDGDTLEPLRSQVERLGLTELVKFVGYIEGSAIPEFLQSLDVYVHASRGETMSTALMQALACGLPIVASDISGIRNLLATEQVGEPLGMLVQNDPGEFAKAIDLLFHSEPLRLELAARGRDYACRHLSNRLQFQKYADIVDRLR